MYKRQAILLLLPGGRLVLQGMIISCILEDLCLKGYSFLREKIGKYWFFGRRLRFLVEKISSWVRLKGFLGEDSFVLDEHCFSRNMPC